MKKIAITARMLPISSRIKIPPIATTPRNIATLFTKIEAVFSGRSSRKQPLTKSSRMTVDVEFRATDRELKNKIHHFY